ncbi:Indole-3-glycerol-phosphate synthase [Komagataella phaffii CBS 7435]|uniref:Multifunctional tryptophan biosynthesis protein n=2 Tax=Komagataella phaffii TaxID=460519 RepID=C4R637_KOMPG|nr:Bifunctional enzyme exhibiting indole-3-glycerol-phosphate synthase and anthranilate synthase activi [Komagataella phaffii GS115]AOA64016.1 GQ67_04090T0 [Komagataella phaffii]CAH2449155.1 Indole-3-glycerol-phosphate synthase [Komagataella phaffii CBS 7435]AOA69382.1 GQ68_04063T0 [Komagataella phaffii GS115]CAY71023.1 Bifunctional enzyme exhibiting indole-3-glycerol-phosphate synthase and anthranilate synthase activi [Komagataella phaffii GS115]CCA39181.1 Indole-3-glycerol-phosphate synthase
MTKRVLLIDNYDSFTWNLYQYLCQEGAHVDVYRNDEITLEQVSQLNPDVVVISPGPGHPTTDSGISVDVIKTFKGKIPIFGVCMGQQCMIAAFGGVVEYAGEIVHGKTSPIAHDGKGLFQHIPDGVVVTRYHSLAAESKSLPPVLEVTAKTDNGIIMGIRHKEYVIEGVQFHPESILTEEGHRMVRNMLEYSTGLWETSTSKTEQAKIPEPKKSILDEIFAKRIQDVEAQKKVPGKSLEHLQKYIDWGLAPKQIDFYQRLQSTISQGKSAILAEIKRASPSKGDIDINANAAEQAVKYATAGCAAISVLTEPTWFKGNIDDLRYARIAMEGIPNRPALLRKEFIFDPYQILEAKLAGADTVLLIVKMLSDETLKSLYNFSLSLGMEPLVEVNNETELKRALKIGSKIIGVNNRNLHDFGVDLNTTSQISTLIIEDDGVILIALSGIFGTKETLHYRSQNVKAFLIGEALMRSKDASSFVKELVETV